LLSDRIDSKILDVFIVIFNHKGHFTKSTYAWLGWHDY
jgi:hypothetical protein